MTTFKISVLIFFLSIYHLPAQHADVSNHVLNIGSIIDKQKIDCIVKTCYLNDSRDCSFKYFKFDNKGRLITEFDESESYLIKIDYMEFSDSLISKKYTIIYDTIKNVIDTSHVAISKFDDKERLTEIRSYSKVTESHSANVAENKLAFSLDAIWKFKNDSQGNNIEIEGKKYKEINISNEGITYNMFDKESKLISSKFVANYCSSFSNTENICSYTEYTNSPEAIASRTVGPKYLYIKVDSLNAHGKITITEKKRIYGFKNKLINDSLVLAIDSSDINIHKDTLSSNSRFFYDKKGRISKITKSDKDIIWEETTTNFIYITDIQILKPEEVFKDHFYNRW